MTSTPQCIILPLDLGVGSLRALAPAIHIAGRLGVSLDVITWSFSETDARRTKPRIEDALADAGCPLPVQTLVTTDDRPGLALAAEATERDAAIVMASHGRGGLTHALLGSTAEDVVASATRPVVLVGPHVWAWRPKGLVLAAVDCSDLAETIIRPATAWAEALRMQLQLVEVIDARVTCPPDVLESGYVMGLSQTFPEGSVSFEVLHGDPAAAITRHATDTDLVALTSHLRSGLSRTVVGSVAMRIVHEARCPVLVGRPAPSQDER